MLSISMTGEKSKMNRGGRIHRIWNIERPGSQGLQQSGAFNYTGVYMVLVNEQERRDYNFGLCIGLNPHTIPLWTCAPCGQHGLALNEEENEGETKRHCRILHCICIL